MNEIRWILSKHKGAVRAFIAVFALLIIGGLAFGIARRAAEAEAPAHAEEITVSTTEIEAEKRREKLLELDELLTRDQRAKRRAYSEQALSLIAFLTANTWTSSGETAVLRFSATAFEEIGSKKEAASAYVIGAMEKDDWRENGVQVSRTTFTIETAKGSYITILTEKRTAKTISATLESDAFETGRTWALSAAAGSIELEGIEGKWCTEKGFALEDVENLLLELCAKRYPTASKARASSQITEDLAQNLLVLTFELNNKAKSKVEVYVNTESGNVALTKEGA